MEEEEKEEEEKEEEEKEEEEKEEEEEEEEEEGDKGRDILESSFALDGKDRPFSATTLLEMAGIGDSQPNTPQLQLFGHDNRAGTADFEHQPSSHNAFSWSSLCAENKAIAALESRLPRIWQQ